MNAACPIPACAGPVAAEDRFCGHCGHFLGHLTLALEGRISGQSWARLDPWRDWSGIPGELRVVLSHEGVGAPLEVSPQTFACQPPWLELQNADERTIGAGESTVWPARLCLPADVPEFATLKLEVKSNDFQAATTVVLSGRPQLQLQPMGGALALNKQGAEMQLELRVVGGAALPALLECRTPGLELMGSDRELATPQSPAAVHLRLKPGLAGELIARRASHLEVELSYPGHPGLGLNLPCRGAPAPQIRGRELSPRLELAVVEGFESRPLILALGNGVTSATWRRPWRIEHLEVAVQGATARVPDGFWPASVESGQTLELPLVIECQQYPAVGALRFVAADDTAWDVPLRLERVARGEYPGWLLLDVGTRGSCAAGKKAGLPVDFFPEVEDGLVDSSVAYLRLSPPEICVGEVARELSATAATRHAVVGGVKRSLLTGTSSLKVIPRHEPLASYELAPARVLSDFLRVWLERLQLNLWARGETGLDFTRVLLCHPARCSEADKATLTDCLREALWGTTTPSRRGALELVTLPESLAAAFSFLSDSTAPSGRRTVLVYDLGGTTLDLCLLEFWAEGKALKWKVLGVDGATDIGGERLIDQFAACLVEQLSQGLPGRPALLASSDRSDAQAFEEFMRIRKAAERAVVSACQGVASWRAFRFEAGSLHWLGEHGLQPLAAVDLELTTEELGPWLAPIVTAGVRCAQRMVQRAGIERPDTVVRAGRASSFPMVVQALGNSFPRADTLAAREPKRCVALGAQRHPRVLAQEGLVTGGAVAGHNELELILVASLGVQIQARFVEFFPAGTRLREEALSTSLEGVHTSEAQVLTILQNRGLDDRIRFENGTWNSEISKLQEVRLPVSDEPLTLNFELSRDGLQVTAGDQGRRQRLVELEAAVLAARF